MTPEEFEIERLRLELVADLAAGDLAAATAEVTRAKRAADAASKALREHVKAGKKLMAKPVGRPPAVRDAALAVIWATPVKRREIVRAIGVGSGASLARPLEALVAAGKVERVARGLYRRAEGV